MAVTTTSFKYSKSGSMVMETWGETGTSMVFMPMKAMTRVPFAGTFVREKLPSKSVN